MKIIQYMKSPIPQGYLDCILSVKQAIPADVPYEFHSTPPIVTEEMADPRYGSDLVRLNMAAQDPEMVWVDADAKIAELGLFVPPNDGFPYFYEGGGEIADICVFYVNGNTQFFKDLLNQFETNEKLHRMYWPQWVINTGMAGKFKLIPKGHFNHLALYKKRNKGQPATRIITNPT